MPSSWSLRGRGAAHAQDLVRSRRGPPASLVNMRAGQADRWPRNWSDDQCLYELMGTT
jgi:hypothetical protein